MRKDRWRLIAPLLLISLLIVQAVNALFLKPSPPPPDIPHYQGEIVSPLATWPWPHAVRDALHPGVTHWRDASSPDGTLLELFDFDFSVNSHLRLEIFDQDENDAVPFDNRAKFWNQGVGQIAHQL